MLYNSSVINSKPGVSNSSSAYLQAAINWTGATGGTILAVLLNKSINVPNGLGFGQASGSNTSWIPYGTADIYDGNLCTARVGPTAYATPTALQSGYIYTVYADASGGEVRINRANVMTNTNAFEIPESVENTVGRSGGDYRITNQTYGEVLVYTRKLTSTEITSVENYLAAKWGTP